MSNAEKRGTSKLELEADSLFGEMRQATKDEELAVIKYIDSKDCARDPYKNIGCHGCSKSANCEEAFKDYAEHCVRYSNAWDICKRGYM